MLVHISITKIHKQKHGLKGKLSRYGSKKIQESYKKWHSSIHLYDLSTKWQTQVEILSNLALVERSSSK